MFKFFSRLREAKSRKASLELSEKCRELNYLLEEFKHDIQEDTLTDREVQIRYLEIHNRRVVILRLIETNKKARIYSLWVEKTSLKMEELVLLSNLDVTIIRT